MRRHRLIPLVAVAALVFSIVLGPAVITTVTPDCPMGFGQPQWELEVWVHEETNIDNSAVELETEVLTSGQTGATIHDLTIAFEDSSGSIYQTEKIGTITGLWNETRTVQLDRAPHRIRLETGAIEKGDDTEYWIKGLERSNGEYEQFTQEHQEC